MSCVKERLAKGQKGVNKAAWSLEKTASKFLDRGPVALPPRLPWEQRLRDGPKAGQETRQTSSESCQEQSGNHENNDQKIVDYDDAGCPRSHHALQYGHVSYRQQHRTSTGIRAGGELTSRCCEGILEFVLVGAALSAGLGGSSRLSGSRVHPSAR